ncbi:protein phosphatase PPM8, putative, partial [Hepatocystis sp. ex Piliocolobus tephrosceles]
MEKTHTVSNNYLTQFRNRRFFLFLLIIILLLFDKRNVTCSEYNGNYEGKKTGTLIEFSEIERTINEVDISFENLTELNTGAFKNNKRFTMVQHQSNCPIEDRCFVDLIDLNNTQLKPLNSCQQIAGYEDRNFAKSFEQNVLLNLFGDEEIDSEYFNSSISINGGMNGANNGGLNGARYRDDKIGTSTTSYIHNRPSTNGNTWNAKQNSKQSIIVLTTKEVIDTTSVPAGRGTLNNQTNGNKISNVNTEKGAVGCVSYAGKSGESSESSENIENIENNKSTVGDSNDNDDGDSTTKEENESFFSKVLNIFSFNKDVDDQTLFATKGIMKQKQFLYFGVVDGHGGNLISDIIKRWLSYYVKKKLLKKIKKKKDGKLDKEDIIHSLRFAHLSLENSIYLHAKDYLNKGFLRFGTIGSCSISVLIDKENYYVANLGDSKIILIRSKSYVLLNHIHNAGKVREQIRLVNEHPNDDDIIICKNRVKTFASYLGNSNFIQINKNNIKYNPKFETPCYVKGRLQCTKSFGDYHLKSKLFAYDKYNNKYLVSKPHSFPYVNADPEIA